MVGLLAAPVLALLILDSADAQSQRRERGGPVGGRPTAAMLQACSDQSLGAACSSMDASGNLLEGRCRAPQSRPLACVPPRGGRDGGGSRQPSDQGEPIAATRADTSAALCAQNTSQLNPTLKVASISSWTCAAGERRLEANGIPDHAVGDFPNRHNPNSIAEQSVSFTTTLSPVTMSGEAWVKVPGYALNGIKFDPGTGGRCPASAQGSADCSMARGMGDWRIEALGQNAFDFGVDSNNAHVRPGGAYHYHGVPEGLLQQADAGKAMRLVGWASDGFPIYARYGHEDPQSATSALRPMRPSYQVKANADSGRPDPNLIPMGAFTQDYEYVAGLGDLDQCNGRTGITPEFPNGIYHYYATDAYPFVQRCVKGALSDTRVAASSGARR